MAPKDVSIGAIETFPSDYDYTILAEKAALEVERYCEDMGSWNDMQLGDSTYKIFTRKSDAIQASEAMLLLTTTLPASIEKLEKLLSFEHPYRIQWDEMLENGEIIRKLPNEIYLVRHLVKKRLALSARESIDVVKLLRSDGKLIFGSTGTTHPQFPPTKSYVRTHQHLGGYYMKQNEKDPEYTDFSMLFHADLNLSAPRFVLSLVDRFKPKLMGEKIVNLRKAIAKYDI